MIKNPEQVISGWGRYPVAKATLLRPESLTDVVFPDRGALICRGEGRSYGDAAIASHGVVLLTAGLQKQCSFDAATGLLVAEAGLTISDILRVFVPQGWFPPVSPGTKFVSLGGAVAADVHGKNHHRDGSIGNYVRELGLILADGSRVLCGPNLKADLFWATVGGMGLTGMIATVTLQLVRVETSSILAQHFKAADLDTAFRWLEDNEHDDQYTVAWIDCLSQGRSLGRSIVMRGHHARLDEVQPQQDPLRVKTGIPYNVPIDFPSFALNSLSVAVFNQVYYVTQGLKKKPFLTDFDHFFYPLDAIGNWNRMYGKRGFLQYQFMIPEKDAALGMRRIIERLAQSRRASFLAVLKRFGSGNAGPLSFPDKGYTLALDLPMTGKDVLDLLDELDDIVIEFGGRVYLAKDARLAAGRFRTMYPRLDDWLCVKREVDPKGLFCSDLSRRLGLGVAPDEQDLAAKKKMMFQP